MWNMGAYTSEFNHADFNLWNQHQKLLANTNKPVNEVDPQTNYKLDSDSVLVKLQTL